jgi:uncharacterized protein YbjT (DUF2867 family)
MIAIAGGTGTLGRELVGRLRAVERPVRVLARGDTPKEWHGDQGIDCVSGDVRDRDVVEEFVSGADVVVSAVHGFLGGRRSGPQAIDRDANGMLIDAAQRAGCERFVLVSVHDARADHPMELHRMKYAAEQHLQGGVGAWSIVRSVPFMETWVGILGEPVRRRGRGIVFGVGRNPINFVSIHDVAAVCTLAVQGDLDGQIVDIGGPENLTLTDVVTRVQAAAGVSATPKHIPRPVMRALAQVLRPIRPAVARQIAAGVAMDTTDMAFDAGLARRALPSVPCTSLDTVVAVDRGVDA